MLLVFIITICVIFINAKLVLSKFILHTNKQTAWKRAVYLLHDAMQTAERSYVVCLSVCNFQVPWSHRLEYFENNFTAES